MVPLASLIVPIVVAAVLVFVVSSIVHMVIGYHRADYKTLPKETEAMDALRAQNLEPALYFFPFTTHTEMKKPEVVERFKRGPVGFVTILPSGPPAMGRNLGLWFGYTLLVGIFTGYVTGVALPRGAAGLQVFRFASTISFLSYGIGVLPDSIWKGIPGSNTLRAFVDGVLYACATGAAFAWLWPR